MYKVDGLKYDFEGHCDGPRNEWVWCGACSKCQYMAETAVDTGKWESPEAWKKWNWEQVMLMRLKTKVAKRRALKELYLKTGNENSLKHTFVTIALKEDYSLPDMVKKVEKIQKNDLYGLEDSIASYEYFSDKHPEGGNLHVHLLAVNNHKKYKPSVIARRVASLFKIESNFVDVINGNDDFCNRLNYVCGIKQGPEKAEFVDKDKKWRYENDLPRVTYDSPFSLREKVEKMMLQPTT